MSRDFTPYEMYMADQDMYKNKGEYLHDMVLFFTDSKGNKQDISCKRFPYIYEKYPNLCFLLGAEECKKIHLLAPERLISSEKRVARLLKEIPTMSEEALMKDSPEAQWLIGKLDIGFYYNEENNRLFIEYLLSEYPELTLECVVDLITHFNYSTNFSRRFATENWWFTLKKESEKYSPFEWSIEGFHRTHDDETISRRFVSLEDCFVAIMNNFNENAQKKNKYHNICDVIRELS